MVGAEDHTRARGKKIRFLFLTNVAAAAVLQKLVTDLHTLIKKSLNLSPVLANISKRLLQ